MRCVAARALRRSGSLAALAVPAVLMGAAPLARAASVVLAGVLGAKALIVVDGGAPKALAVGESHQGVKLLSVQGDGAVVEAAGQRRGLRVGESPAHVSGPARAGGGDTIVLHAGSDGHFFGNAVVNGQTLPFMVDTGASSVGLSAAQAARVNLSLNAENATPVLLGTANGTVRGWKTRLASIRVGDVTLYEVDATVTGASMPYVLLGNSFLNRFQMRRDGDQMVLIRRY